MHSNSSNRFQEPFYQNLSANNQLLLGNLRPSTSNSRRSLVIIHSQPICLTDSVSPAGSSITECQWCIQEWQDLNMEVAERRWAAKNLQEGTREASLRNAREEVLRKWEASRVAKCNNNSKLMGDIHPNSNINITCLYPNISNISSKCLIILLDINILRELSGLLMLRTEVWTW